MQIVKIPKFVQSIFPSLVWKKENSEKEIYLTFDDSPTPEFTLWILNLLSRLNIKATFFCVGRSSEKYTFIVSRSSIFSTTFLLELDREYILLSVRSHRLNQLRPIRLKRIRHPSRMDE